MRPFACHLCDKSYGRKDYLERHLKGHNNPDAAGVDPVGEQHNNSTSSELQNPMPMASRNNEATLNEVVTVVGPEDDLSV